MTTATIQLPPKLVPMFAAPRGSVQYRAPHGGRGSAKSFSCALMASVFGYAEPLRILCTREFQASIKESFHAELKAAIASYPWLDQHYDVGVDYLRGANGTEFIFRGLRQGINSIKSLAKIDLTIVEEAEDVPEASWLALEATVFRQPGSELWPIWNPRLDGSPVDMRMRKNPPSNAIVTEINHSDNPFFPPGLDTLRRREQSRLDPATYAHIWEGAYLVNSTAQVLSGKWRIAEFEAKDGWDGPYQGGDFGYAQDPTAAVRCYIHASRLAREVGSGQSRKRFGNQFGNRSTSTSADRATLVKLWALLHPWSLHSSRRLHKAVLLSAYQDGARSNSAFSRWRLRDSGRRKPSAASRIALCCQTSIACSAPTWRLRLERTNACDSHGGRHGSGRHRAFVASVSRFGAQNSTACYLFFGSLCSLVEGHPRAAHRG